MNRAIRDVYVLPDMSWWVQMQKLWAINSPLNSVLRLSIIKHITVRSQDSQRLSCCDFALISALLSIRKFWSITRFDSQAQVFKLAIVVTARHAHFSRIQVWTKVVQSSRVIFSELPSLDVRVLEEETIISEWCTCFQFNVSRDLDAICAAPVYVL